MLFILIVFSAFSACNNKEINSENLVIDTSIYDLFSDKLKNIPTDSFLQKYSEDSFNWHYAHSKIKI